MSPVIEFFRKKALLREIRPLIVQFTDASDKRDEEAQIVLVHTERQEWYANRHGLGIREHQRILDKLGPIRTKIKSLKVLAYSPEYAAVLKKYEYLATGQFEKNG